MASLFQTIGAAGYNSASPANLKKSNSGSPSLSDKLNSAIDTSRSQSAAAVDTARNYGNNAIDASRSGVSASQRGVDSATEYGNRAIDSSQSGVDAILSGRPYVDQAYSNMLDTASSAKSAYDEAAESARGMDPYISGLSDAAGDVRGVADSLTPYAEKLGGYGDSLWESGTKVTEQALATLGTGLGFINMDSSASPLVAEAVRLYKETDPNRRVAAAAQDMQLQGDSVRAQNERDLARRGVSATSGASQALRQQFDRALAVAKAAAMTRARERGQTDQQNALQTLIANNANTFLQTGGQLASIGSSAQSNAVNAQDSAAGVLGTQGSLYNAVASLLGQAGSLKGTQASTLANVASGTAGLSSIYGNASNLITNYDKDLQSAYNALANTTQSAGNAITGANNSLAGAHNSLANATQSAGNAVSAAQQGQATNTANTERTRVSAANGGTAGVRIIDNTDRAIQARLLAGQNPIAS